MAKELVKLFSSFFCFASILIILAVGCRNKQQAEQQSTIRVDSLQSVLAALDDSIDVTWQEMLTSDAQKLRHIDTLLFRIQQTKQYDKALFEEVAQVRATLASKRYTRPEDLSSSQIDAYDVASDSLITGTIQLYERLPNPDRCENCEYLASHIREMDETVLPYRLRYDRHVDTYNAFVNQNQTVLRANNPAFDSLRTKPLFRLPQ